MNSQICENLAQVRKNIEEACRSVNRDPSEVELVAVSKTKPVSMLQEAYDAGQRAFGENKVQEILEKQPVLPVDIKWHMIGHLQRNKVRQVIDKACLIHSVDSMRLAACIEEEAARKGLVVPVLLEVNVAEEDTKYGFHTAELFSVVDEILRFSHLELRGLMTIAPFVANPEQNRGIFRQLKKISIDIAEKNNNNNIMETLSMGMTGDYQVAIQEGATIVRVGTGIFGEREYHI